MEITLVKFFYNLVYSTTTPVFVLPSHLSPIVAVKDKVCIMPGVLIKKEEKAGFKYPNRRLTVHVFLIKYKERKA
jgi:hypothetical protein